MGCKYCKQWVTAVWKIADLWLRLAQMVLNGLCDIIDIAKFTVTCNVSDDN